MKYFIDAEFVEDGITIEPLSIALVAEDGREFYAEISDVDHSRANPWVQANVLPYLWSRQEDKRDGNIWVRDGGVGGLMTRERAARDILNFVTGPNREFWAFCGAWDWVVLNQLYGPMDEHPNNWPYYCNDIAQLCHNLGFNRRSLPPITEEHGPAHHALSDARWCRDAYMWLRHKGAVIN